jgi:F0F1-type ATP synthase assembly protein I
VGENLTQVRRSVYDQRLLSWSLAIGLVVGLAAHVGGYVLSSPATTEPLGLVADLLIGLGWALWTRVVVVVFVELFQSETAATHAGAGRLCGSAAR